MILPWCVDVPQDRWPVANWLILIVTVGVFVLQVSALHQSPPHSSAAAAEQTIPGITGVLMLNGWGLTGLFGYMWLHGGLFHLLGNMWFLWVFGNAVCAKVGNLRYLVLYVLLGVAAGVTYLLFGGDKLVGASGAINGVVGMYLVLFYENSITCYWAPILIYWRQFTVSSFWMILFWLFWDILGASFGGVGSSVAYFAHLGGFGAGFAVTLYMCKHNWITMERYEKSLWQWWQQRQTGPPQTSLDAARAQLGRSSASQDPPLPGPTSEQVSPYPQQKPVPCLSFNDGSLSPPSDGRLRVTCDCGRTLRLSAQYAGKIVRCPHCRAEVAVERDGTSSSQAVPVTPDNDLIRFACTCGRRMKVPSHYAGRVGKCPQCGVRVRIPHSGR
jgi:membrane associated rhomboid family serine protease/DNA-directed RNA polymerase subunit RPC12/RpoP